MSLPANKPTTASHSYIPEIDGLRALAVLSVLFFHLKASLIPGGFSGVDVFFVISGYVVSGSLAKEGDSGFWRFATDFYSRRIIRIYPALVLCLLVTTVLHCLLIPPSWLSVSSAKTGLAAFFGWSNFALIQYSDGYFSPRVEFNTFTHTWSLAVEEQFYLLFPAIFLIWLKGRHRKDIVGFLSNWLLASLLLVSFLIAVYQTSAKPDHAYYLLPSRFWELACGAMLYKLYAQNRLQAGSRRAADARIASGLVLIGLGFVLCDPAGFPFPWALLPVVGTMLAISGVTSAARGDSAIGKLLNNRPIVYIGKISYSLYLWHWPVIVVLRWTVGIETPVAIMAALACTFAASALSYRYVEVPIRSSAFFSGKPAWVIVSRGVAAVALCAVVANGIFHAQKHISLSVTRDKGNWYPYPEKQKTVPGGGGTGAGQYQGRTLYVLGDSHVDAYSALLRMLQNEQGTSVQQFSAAGCAVANLLADASPDCARFIDEKLAEITSTAKTGDIVLLASLRMNRLGDQWATYDAAAVAEKQSGPDAAPNRKAALAEAQRIIDRLESAGLTVVIDAPMPVFKSPPFRCSDWFNAGNPVCKGGLQLRRDFLLQHRQPVMDSLAELQRTHPRLVVWDAFPLLCPTEVCSAMDKDLPIFFDGDHLSGHGNRLLYPSFVALLKDIWAPVEPRAGNA